MADAPVMEIRGIVKTFGPVRAVDGVTFSLNPGEVHGFIGPNGAGKTTTMRIMAGVEPPDSGDVLFEGVSVIDHPERCRPRIGFMPDYLDSYPRILVWEYLDFYARIYGQPPRRRRRRLADVVEFVKLGEMAGRPVEALSKGWKQRLSLARVLLNDPGVLILDEPAAGLDPRARLELRDLVTLLAERGKAVFISSHILTELSEMCQSVTIIENGRLHVSSAIDELRTAVDKGQRVRVELADPDPAALDRLLRVLLETPGVADARPLPLGAAFSHQGAAAPRAAILAALIRDGFRVAEYRTDASSLEDAFIVMTGGKQQ